MLFLGLFLDALLHSNREKLLHFFQSVKEYEQKLGNLNTWWNKVSLIGKINSLNVPQSLLANMLDTKEEFAELQEDLIENLFSEQLLQQQNHNKSVAQILVDIPNRNLFERTADVGFLATDTDIIHFLSTPSNDTDQKTAIQQRLIEYASKYTVYDDILLLDTKGHVKAQLDIGHPVTKSREPILDEVLKRKEPYYEFCGHSDLRPNQALCSLFMAPIVSSVDAGEKVLGVLCLSFKLQNEMQALFKDLDKQQRTVMALLDAKGKVLVSSQPSLLGPDAIISSHADQHVLSINKQTYIVNLADTRGYQGYNGLGWRGCVLLPLASLDEKASDTKETEPLEGEKWQGFSSTLTSIRKRAKVVTDDLDLVVLNGRIAAARSDADEFIPILEEIRNIGRQMSSIFTDSVSQLMGTAVKTHFNDLTFDAALLVDIMDRNLYERANDCRWWALTSVFSKSLKSKNLSDEERQTLSDVLLYINSLYTVYTTLYLYNSEGHIVATSNAQMGVAIGDAVNTQSNWQSTKNLASPQQYCVSKFVPSPYYQNEHTYIYNAVIRCNKNIVGGIGIVFDSTPQFRDMLDEVVGSYQGERMAVYLDRSGKVISASTGAPWKVGTQLAVPQTIRDQAAGAKGAGVFSFDNVEYTVGYAVSKGYREYKVSDNYHNDVIAIVLEKNKTS